MCAKIFGIGVDLRWIARIQSRIGWWHLANGDMTPCFEGFDEGFEELNKRPRPRANNNSEIHSCSD